MADLHQAIAAEADRTAFSGVVRVDRGGETLVAQAFGLADRGREVPNTVGTRLALASGAKGFTALVVMSLVEDGTLALDTTARSVLGDDLPLIDSAVTVEHLLAHRSGIEGWMGPLAVRPEWQGGGLGKEIVKAGVRWLAERSSKVIGLETMPRTMDNIGFYSGLGFLPTRLTITLTLDAASGDVQALLFGRLSSRDKEDM